MTRRLSSKGFTIIELLVVIAVLALLAAIIYPVYKSVSERSRRTACISNLHQIAQAIRTYAADSRGLLPPAPKVDPMHPGAPPHARSSRPEAPVYQRYGLGCLVPDPLAADVIVCKKAVESPPTTLPETTPVDEVEHERDLQMMFWQRIDLPGQPAPKWVKGSYHYRPDFYSAGDGFVNPGRLTASPNNPVLMQSLGSKLPRGTDPQLFLEQVLLKWDRPIVFDYNHRTKDRSGVLYVNLEGAASYEATSTVIVQSPWPPF